MRVPTYFERVAEERRRRALWFRLRLASLVVGLVLGVVLGPVLRPAEAEKPPKPEPWGSAAPRSPRAEAMASEALYTPPARSLVFPGEPPPLGGYWWCSDDLSSCTPRFTEVNTYE